MCECLKSLTWWFANSLAHQSSRQAAGGSWVTSWPLMEVDVRFTAVSVYWPQYSSWQQKDHQPRRTSVLSLDSCGISSLASCSWTTFNAIKICWLGFSYSKRCPGSLPPLCLLWHHPSSEANLDTLSKHLLHPIHMAHCSVNLTYMAQISFSAFTVSYSFSSAESHSLFPADIPNLFSSLVVISLPLLLLLAVWLLSVPVIFFIINRVETKSAIPHTTIISRISPFNSSLRWQTLPFVYSPIAVTMLSSELIWMSFASSKISQQMRGSASVTVSIRIDAYSPRRTLCCNNHGHFVLSWGEMCLLQWSERSLSRDSDGNGALIS